MKKSYFILFTLLILTACKSVTLSSNEMQPDSFALQRISTNEMLEDTINISNISISPNYKSTPDAIISHNAFSSVVKNSLMIMGYVKRAANANAKYNLSVEFLDINKKFGLIKITKVSKVHYKLVRKSDNKVVYDKTLTVSGEANVLTMERVLLGSKYGDEPNKLASGNSIRQNIGQFLRALSTLKL